MDPQAPADFRFAAHEGLMQNIVPGPKSAAINRHSQEGRSLFSAARVDLSQ